MRRKQYMIKRRKVVRKGSKEKMDEEKRKKVGKNKERYKEGRRDRKPKRKKN